MKNNAGYNSMPLWARTWQPHNSWEEGGEEEEDEPKGPKSE